jgi:DNA-binding transcriptional regulator GbsR (MarR family)
MDDPRLEAARQRFIGLWAQMGSRWGIPRCMAEVHALLFITGKPMHSTAVMEALGISRGSASTTLRGLAEWGLVRQVRRRGDRKEYYQADQDVWNMFRTILRERKKREIDPLLDELRACREAIEEIDADASPEVQAHGQRLGDLIAFVGMVEIISRRFIQPTGGLQEAAEILQEVSSTP